jgi:hypothetical protein
MKNIQKILGIAAILLLIPVSTLGQKSTRTENIVFVTLDGLRWQEVFQGIDSALLNNKVYTRNYKETSARFWDKDSNKRREKLMPFLWSEIEKNGRIYGNRLMGNKSDVKNPYQFSYPGYNEIFSGYADKAVNSNEKIPNANSNIFDFLNTKPGFKGNMAVFSSWDAFPYIVNKWRNGTYVNADTDSLNFNDNRMMLINDMQNLTTRPVGVRPDVFTYFAAREYAKLFHPRVLFIGFDETDDFAHAGEYEQYLNSAKAEDAMLADLWLFLESDPFYKGKTTLIVTCDHGRGGKGLNTWKDHGEKIPESGETWFAVMGPDTQSGGEIKQNEQFFHDQFAATIALLLGYEYVTNHPIGTPIQGIIN